MTNVLQWISLVLGIAVVAWGSVNGLSLKPNEPVHRAHGKGDNWRT
jgi:hypothetical protein